MYSRYLYLVQLKVWRSTRDWDQRSHAMLAEYMRAVKSMVQVKQARLGVAVHVRLGGTDAGGVDERGRACRSGSNAGSYAIWAITAGRDGVDDVRVGCSEAAQTEVPRKAIQRVSVRINMHNVMLRDFSRTSLVLHC